MKVFVFVVCDGHEREFEIACGAGDKTFKWLSLAASNMWAAAAPNGALRRRDDYRGVTGNVEQHATNVVLPDGSTPHPAALIADYLRDQDSVEITLVSEMAVNSLGAPNASNWSTLAFTANEDHLGVLYDDNATSRTDVSAVETEEQIAEKSKSEFMRIIMRSQMLNDKRIAHELRTVWTKACLLLPKLREADNRPALEAIFKDWGVLQELFSLYAPTGEMDLKEFQRMCEDADVFPPRDHPMLSARAFNRIPKVYSDVHGENISTLSIPDGTFVASLLVLAQTRHNDIYEKQSKETSPVGYLKEILTNNFRVLANVLAFKCLPKEALCSTTFLCNLRDVYDDLIAVFEKYAARHNREVYGSLPFEHFSELLYEARLTETVEISKAQELFKIVRSGPIIGRDKDLNPPHPENEYLFPEMVEAATLCQYQIMVRKSRGVTSPLAEMSSIGGTPVPSTFSPNAKKVQGSFPMRGKQETPSKSEEAAAEEAPSSPYPVLPDNIEPVDIQTAYNMALQKLVFTLTVVPAEEKGGKNMRA